MTESFRDLCELKDGNCIVLKDIPAMTSISVESNEDWLNNLLGHIFHRIHTAKDERPDLKDYKLSEIMLGKQVFDDIKKYFNIKPSCNFIKIFEVFTIANPTTTNATVFKYSWDVFEMGSKGES